MYHTRQRSRVTTMRSLKEQIIHGKIMQCFEQEPKKLAEIYYSYYKVSNKECLVETLYLLINNKIALTYFLDILCSKNESKPKLVSSNLDTSKNADLGKVRNGWRSQIPVLSFNLVALEMLSPSTRNQVLQEIKGLVDPKYFEQNAVVTSVTEALELLACQPTNPKAFAASFLLLKVGWDLWMEYQRWLDNEIDGQRLVKNVVTYIAAIAGGLGGGYGCAVVGNSLYSGVGTLVGGVLGGLYGHDVAESLSRWLVGDGLKRPKGEL